MLVVHANWTAGALRLWAESVEACSGAAAARPERAGGQGPASASTALLASPAAPPATAHPFAAAAGLLVERLVGSGLFPRDGFARADGGHRIELRLPAAGAVPRPSDRLTSLIGSDEWPLAPELGTFFVPAVALREDECAGAILGLEQVEASPGIDFGSSLRYWIAVARFVVELLADQRFIPTLIQTRAGELRAAWQPWLHDEEARTRVGALLLGMPPVVRAVADEHAGRRWPILREALGTLADATVRRALIDEDFARAVDGRDHGADPHVSWLAGLLGPEARVAAPADGGSEMLHDVRRWIVELDESGRERPLRLGFVLREPPESSLPQDGDPLPAGARWRLGLRLLGTGAEAVMIEAEQLWRDPAAVRLTAAGGVESPEELFLAELGRATRIYPRLESALSEAEPAGIDLTTAEASAFLTEFKDLLVESGFAVEVPAWWGQPSARIGARLRVEAPDLPPAAAGGSAAARGENLLGLNSLVAYRWQVAVGDQPLSMEEFRALARAADEGCLVRLRGRWVELVPEQLAAASSFFADRPGGEISLLEAIRLAHGAGGGEMGLPVLGLDTCGWVAELLGASSGDGTMPHLPQPRGFLGRLRPYQEVGLSWLAFLDRYGLGACLADDMGLGKTIQLIALLLHERETAAAASSVGPTLLIVPTSVVANWQREIERFAPNLRVHVHHGPERPVGERFAAVAASHDVVVTTYALISRDRETLVPLAWHRVALDEAQFIKNPPTKQTVTIRSLRTPRRVALTGTPVENRLSELWSIMEFCNPGYLGPAGEFRRRFAVPIERHRDRERAEQLRQLVRPFVLRRLKTDPKVIGDLPPCVVTREYATLTSEQAVLYEQVVNRMLGQVGRAAGIQRRGLVLATLVRLKQICNHPALLENGAVPSGAGAEGSEALLSHRSGKSARLLQMLEEIHATGDRALLFTQFRRMGHLLAAMIKHDLDTEVLFLHGGTPPRRRQQMIDRFQDPAGGPPVFVLSLRAGGIGVNLTAANHVFHFDRWWNPAVENQATDRAFRIGQTRTVHVHKFVCQGTLEERIDQMLEQKTELAQNIIGAGEQWLTELSTMQLRELLTLRQSAMEGES